ncbi:MAG: hypothetical protein ABIR96_08030 [Bdellovibrionota bacterium]
MKTLSTALLVAGFLANATASIALTRPPQFVMLAFDNCGENQSWQQVSDFLDEINGLEAGRLKFTFFLSATGLLTNAAKTRYENPSKLAREDASTERDPERSIFPERARAIQQGRSFADFGRANIDFGGSQADVLTRIAHINALHAKGNEIASHAVGHFDGRKWTREMWAHEMHAYNDIVDHSAELNGFTGATADKARLQFRSADIAGFRAPYLEGPASLIETIAKLGYRYDTSNTDQGSDPRTWPRRYKIASGVGPWNFGLGFIFAPGIVTSDGRPLKIPAMDYNFCFRQDKGCPEKYPDTLRTVDRDAHNMLVAYLNYFVTNYNGNRAPINIGHHFQQYRGGRYNQSLMTFARVVCGLPEVRCTVYSELAKFMDSLATSDRDDMQAARFDKAAYRPSLEELLKKTGH